MFDADWMRLTPHPACCIRCICTKADRCQGGKRQGQDRKIVFGLSCATLSCPNIQQQAFTSSNTGQLLERSAREFINHPRGVNLKNKQLQASQIFQWFGHDFGSDKKMIKFFAHYAEDLKALYLLSFSGEIAYSFDSRVNAPETIWPL